MVKALEDPRIAGTIGAGAMSTPLLSSLGDITTIACALIGIILSMVAIVIQLKKNARGKKRHELELELLRKKLQHEDIGIAIDDKTLRSKKS